MSLAIGSPLESVVDALARRADADPFLDPTDPDGDGGLVHVERIPARPARFGTLSRPLPAPVASRLGVEGLWPHQAEALDHPRAGRSVALATGTASGKSLCYQVAIAEAAIDPVRPGTALLLFPTKALA